MAEHSEPYCKKHKQPKEIDRDHADGDRNYYICPECVAGTPAFDERCSYCWAGIKQDEGRYRAGLPGVACMKCAGKLNLCE